MRKRFSRTEHLDYSSIEEGTILCVDLVRNRDDLRRQIDILCELAQLAYVKDVNIMSVLAKATNLVQYVT